MSGERPTAPDTPDASTPLPEILSTTIVGPSDWLVITLPSPIDHDELNHYQNLIPEALRGRVLFVAGASVRVELEQEEEDAL